MAKQFEIEGKTIGPGRPTYIIAEIGINHNGDEESAYRLIDAALEAKADAVKFQKRHLSSLYTEEVLDHPERFEQNFQYMIPLLKKVELPDEAYLRIKEYCDRKKITFICTPFDIKSADFVYRLGGAAFKIASADLTNSALLDYVGQFGKPIILSTGMSTWTEIETAVETMRKSSATFALLHCRSVYPVWPREVNLRMINRLKQYDVPVGYSGHELGITIPLVAASMGAEIIEKHLTLNRRQKGPDHKVSLEPYEFKRLVRDIKVADQAIGKEKRFMLRGEVLNRELFGKSLLASRSIKPGEPITEDCMVVKGPGRGLAPDRKNELIGKIARRAISQDDCFVEEDITGPGRQNFDNSFSGTWGLIARFSDYQNFLKYNPRVIEFHLAERDFEIPFQPESAIECGLIVHAPEYLGDHLLDLCSGDETIRSASVRLVNQTIELALGIRRYFQGAPKVIAHPGAMSLQAKLDRNALSGALERSLAEIRKHWAGEDFQLLFENLPPYPWYFGGQWKGNYFMSGTEIVEFCSKTEMSICFDLSHAALYCNAKHADLAQMVITLLPYTRHLHLADGYGLDGEGVQFGEGDIDIDRILPLFKSFEGSWVPEVWRGHLNNGQGFITALEYLRKYDL